MSDLEQLRSPMTTASAPARSASGASAAGSGGPAGVTPSGGDFSLQTVLLLCGAVAAVVSLATIDALSGIGFNASIIYPSLLVVCWWVRSRRFLWALAGLSLIATLVAGLLEAGDQRAWLHRGMSLTALLVGSIVFHNLLSTWRAMDQTAAELRAREHDIAAQNEELRTQTEEFERQSEELRLANAELSRRQRTLEALLRLSRSLTAELSRAETLDRICQALAEMLNGPGLAVGVKLRQAQQLRLVCHYGFGPAGPRSESIPYERSFARLVLERNQTGYLEDVSLRPDLEMPQPKQGEPFRSVLAAPLRVNGRAIGTLEVFSRDRRSWSEEQIGMIESLAAQTSISLQAAELYERLEQERRRFETIVRTMPIGVSVAHVPSGRITNNAAAMQMLALPAESSIEQRRQGKHFRLFRGGVPLPAEQAPLLRALQGQEVIGEELEVVLGGGRRLTVLASAAPIYTPQHQIEGAVVAFTDVTALKRLQAELDARRREAEESSVRKTRFLAQVSHDIRNPVHAISMLAELLHRAACEPALAREVPEIAADIRKNAVSLVELVSDVLDLARFEVGRIELEYSEFDLFEMIRDECRGYQELAVEKGLDFACELPDGRLFVRTDRVKLSRVLGNLLSNALKFTQQGRIEVAVGAESAPDQPPGPVHIRVNDTGPGIPPEFHQQIFDEFFQLRHGGSSSPAGRGGAGLGLAICKRLVEAMGGQIRVESEPGKGSSFVLTLPGSCIVAREEPDR
ncbi:MAG TPA: ATP-binding protein, partial [Tepidisphaeraceae bacterium]|nr:ATP-binding protein [Tepidisphaeraceae bacterium]